MQHKAVYDCWRQECSMTRTLGATVVINGNIPAQSASPRTPTKSSHSSTLLFPANTVTTATLDKLS